MSKLGQLRKRVNYETDVPRCASCLHYRHSMVYLRDSLPRVSQILCVLHQFNVRPNAICDKWTGKDGDVLGA